MFADKVSALDGRTYRLPTTEEWRTYIDDGQPVAPDAAWLADTSDGETHTRCKAERNAYGLCDVIGNVAEWTTSSNEAGEVTYRVQGGSGEDEPSGPWRDAGRSAEVSNLEARDENAGFRLVTLGYPGAIEQWDEMYRH